MTSSDILLRTVQKCSLLFMVLVNNGRSLWGGGGGDMFEYVGLYDSIFFSSDRYRKTNSLLRISNRGY